MRTPVLFLALMVGVGFSAAAKVRDFYFDYADGVKTLDAGDCQRASELLRAAIAQEPAESARKRTYGMNVIEYYPHLHLARALVCLGRRDEAAAEIAVSEKQGAAQASEIARIRALMAKEAPSDVVAILKSPRSSEDGVIPGLVAAISMAARIITIAEGSEAAAVADVRGARPKAIVAVGDRASRLARESLPDFPCLTLVTHATSETRGASLVLMPDLGIQLEVVKRVLPGLRRLGVIYDPEAGRIDVEVAERDAASSGVVLALGAVRSVKEAPPELRSLLSKDIDAVLMTGGGALADADLFGYVASTVVSKGLPLLTYDPEKVKRGALMALYPSSSRVAAKVAGLLSRVLRGESLESLGAFQADSVDYDLNLRVAKSLGIAVPDEVIRSAAEVVGP